MTYQNVPYADAVEAAHKGLPFTICWEFTGANDKNKSGASDKFWLIERNFVGNTRHGSVFRRFGKRGQSGTRQENPQCGPWSAPGSGKGKKGVRLLLRFRLRVEDGRGEASYLQDASSPLLPHPHGPRGSYWNVVRL